METPKILIVDDDKSVLASLLILFRHHGFEPVIESDPKKITSLLKEHTFEAVVLDMNFRRGYNEGKEGIHWLDTIRQLKPDLHVILITAYGDIDLAVEAVKKGAADFILKPWDNDNLVSKVQNAVEARRKPRQQKAHQSVIVGESEATAEVKSLIRKVAESAVSVLITGERGTGKNLVAREIHALYHQGATALHKLDGATLTESDLVKLGNAAQQTFMLRHPGEMKVDLQQAFLRFLEEHRSAKFITMVESKEELEALPEEMKSPLSLIEIAIQPLRNRPEDISALVDFFIGEFAGRYDRDCEKLSADAERKVMKYHWPGNVAELLHCIERAVILSESEEIAEEYIKIESSGKTSSVTTSGTLNLSELEKEAILKAIEDSNGNITKASKKLGITRTALYRRMEKYDI